MGKGKKLKKSFVRSEDMEDNGDAFDKYCSEDNGYLTKSQCLILQSKKRMIQRISDEIHNGLPDHTVEEDSGQVDDLMGYFERKGENSKDENPSEYSVALQNSFDKVCVEYTDNYAETDKEKHNENTGTQVASTVVQPPPTSVVKNDEEKEQEKGEKRDNISARSLAKLLMSLYQFIVVEKLVYFYEKLFGYYIPLVGENAEIIIRQCIPEKLSHKITSYMVCEIVWWLKAEKCLQVEPKALQKRCHYINFIDGVLEVISGRFYHHRHDLYFTNYVNAKYKSESSGKIFDSFIEKITGGDKKLKMLLQEIGGYIISEIRTLKKAIFCIGASNTGKSTLIELLSKIVGEEFCSSLSFHEINEKFKLVSIVGKKLNASAEIGEINTDRYDVFKKLTGNDILTVEDKGKPAFSFRNTAALLMAGNEFPKSKDADITNAFFNRVIIVPFVNSLPENEQDHDLVEKIWEHERSYVVNWCVIGLQRLISNNLVFTTSEISQRVKMEQVYEQNSFKAFIDIACILEPESETCTSEILTSYRKFCMQNELIKLDDNIVHRYLKNVLGLKQSRSRDENQHNKRGYKGIKVKEDAGSLLI